MSQVFLHPVNGNRSECISKRIPIKRHQSVEAVTCFWHTLMLKSSHSINMFYLAAWNGGKPLTKIVNSYLSLFICLHIHTWRLQTSAAGPRRGMVYQGMCQGKFIPEQFSSNSAMLGRSKLACAIKCDYDLCCNAIQFEQSTEVCNLSYRTTDQCSTNIAPQGISFYRVSFTLGLVIK